MNYNEYYNIIDMILPNPQPYPLSHTPLIELYQTKLNRQQSWNVLDLRQNEIQYLLGIGVIV